MTVWELRNLGDKSQWLYGSVKSILTKREKVNEGENPQYYIENYHPAIIEPEVYNMMQKEFERKKKGKTDIVLKILTYS